MKMSCSLTFASSLPSLSPPTKLKNHYLFVSSEQKAHHSKKQACMSINQNKIQDSRAKILGLAIQVGGVLTAVAVPLPAFGVTGVNEELDLVWTLIQSAISAFLYFIVAPPLIMNWLRTRWYRRKLLEMYVQFMCVFLFFPGVLLWAPFVNVRKFPRDPSLKYPWSVPENPSMVKGGFRKFPWATPEDYD
ncbi:hypothetical protein ACS0TY_008699 [Phlomoides rotata]